MKLVTCCDFGETFEGKSWPEGDNSHKPKVPAGTSSRSTAGQLAEYLAPIELRKWAKYGDYVIEEGGKISLVD